MAGFPKAGDQYGGRYRIVDEIGHGGMGVVYEALDTVLNRAVALKIVLPSLADREEYHQRFAQEAAALAKIQSRHIVGIYDYGEHEDTVFFATQYFPDGDLQSWLVEHGPLDRRAALTLVAQICEALADAHAAGVVHRDVKPGNVLLWNRPEGLVPYLADFGIAVEGSQDKRSSLTRTGTLIGSPAYMAPERHFGHPADERGDVYSAGCLLWAALTGDAPYAGTDFQMMNSHINAAVVTLGTDHPVDLRIDAVLAGALEKDPARRIPSAAAMRTQLTDIVREIDTAALPIPLPPGPMPTSAPPSAPPAAPPAAATPPPVPPVAPVPSEESSAADAGRTAVRPAMVPAAAPGGPPADDPPVADVAARERTPRRRLLPLLLAAAVVAVIAIVAAILLDRGGDEPVADDPGPTQGTSAATPSPTETTDAPPLAAPEAPSLTARPGDRAVRFTVTSADSDATTEVNVGKGWQRAAPQIVVRTEQGGDRACVRARSVARSDGQQAVSDITRGCGRAAPRQAALVPTTETCSGTASNGYTGPCRWYALRLSGFASGTSALARTRAADSPEWCPTDTACREVRIGVDGRAEVPHFFRIFSDSGTWVYDVDGVTGRTQLDGP